MTSPEQNFSGALATWKDINLAELQKTLDAQGIEVVDYQRESVVGRKSLADKTKEFKKIPDAEKLNAFKGLLKAYQTEIDNLTKRSKASENAFLNVYKLLAEAPDPYPLLEAAVDQTAKIAEAREMESEVLRLREENTELRRRVSDMSSADAARKKTETRVEQLEQKMDELIQEKVVQKENELNATYDEKLRNYEEREQDLQRQISLSRSQLRDLRVSHESNQAKLMDQSQRQDQEVVAKLAELDMIVEDLERANSRVAAVERRNELLRAEIETMRAGNESSEKVRALEAQVVEFEEEISRLTYSSESHKQAAAEQEANSNRRVDSLTLSIQQKTREVDQLKQKLKRYDDYDEIKRELDIMKYVEFGGTDEDNEESDDISFGQGYDLHLPSPNPERVNIERGKSLEALLAIKNKRLLEELTKFRILHSELEKSLEECQLQVHTLTSDLDKKKQLNEKLESDLVSMNIHKPNGNATSPENGSDLLAGIELNRKTQESNSRSPLIPFAASADTSILPIVTSQRDRFRQRNAELEEELRKQFQIISDLRAEIKTLQADNLKLYEKVRYMQSYKEESGFRPPTTQLDPLPAPRGRADDMSKYHRRYEEAMNPFEAFRGREATRAYNNLNPFERGVLVLTRSVLGNRRARTFFIFYALALHLLVMFTTYECTTSATQLQKQPSPYGS